MATVDSMADLDSGVAAPFIPSPLPPLEPGDHLDQPTFHARYQAMPEDFRAELIGGIVYMPSPAKRPHGRHHQILSLWLGEFETATPFVESYSGPTVILGEESESQPDLCLLLLPEQGGRTRDHDDYIVGPPELVVEVASSTEAIDLHAKKLDYERAGVNEYIVVALRQRRVHWFSLRDGKFVDFVAGSDGILRSEQFPGLWLDPAALLARDSKRLIEVLRRGIASPEHGAWVAKIHK